MSFAPHKATSGFLYNILYFRVILSLDKGALSLQWIGLREKDWNHSKGAESQLRMKYRDIILINLLL
jgi:hypothetical protein